jgi:glutathione synthase/RimK-type ligase-like ATP-grasp enzyme
MLVGIHKDENGRIDPYLRIYEAVLDYNGIRHVRIEASQPDFWEVVSSFDLIVFHWVYVDRDQQMAETLIPVIENEMGVKCFPNWNTFWHYNNKIKQYYLLKNHRIPVIESYIFWEEDVAKKWIEQAPFPLVFKLSKGALSQDVRLLRSKEQAKELTSRMFGKGIRPGCLNFSNNSIFTKGLRMARHLCWVMKQKLRAEYVEQRWQVEKGYIFFQRFLPDNDFTTRIVVIGDRAFGFTVRNNENDFRAFDMQKVDCDREKVDLRCVKKAFQISSRLGFQCMAYDFLFDEGGKPRVCEMGYTSYALDLYNCPGYWDIRLSWHDGHFWPQYCQLVDLLGLRQLKQPEIDFERLSTKLVEER